jgi:hypothetical protein
VRDILFFCSGSSFVAFIMAADKGPAVGLVLLSLGLWVMGRQWTGLE